MTATPRGHVREAAPDDLPRLLAVQTASLAEPWPDLLETAVGSPGMVVLVVCETPDGPPVGYALAVPRGAADGSVGGEGTDADGGGTDGNTDGEAGDEDGSDEAGAGGGDSADAEDGTGEVGSDAVYLAEFAVAPGHRDRGLGSALLEALVERVDAALELTVRADDERARAFYERRGFEVRASYPDHYETGEGLLLVRDRDGAGGT